METSVYVSASVPNADEVETASVREVPEVHGGVKELHPEHQAPKCLITDGTPALTFRGIQSPGEEGEVHLSPSAEDQVSMCGKTRSRLKETYLSLS